MQIRPWFEVERLLQKEGKSYDEIFDFKNQYFDRLSGILGEDPEDEELKRKRKLFLYGNEREWELLKSTKSGLIRGLGEVPETAADIFELGQKIVPGENEEVTAVKEGLRGEAQRIRESAGPFQPSSFQEKLVGGLAAVPGAVASMLPVTAPVAAATPALAPALGAGGAGALTGAIGFGAYEAIRNARGSWGDVARGGQRIRVLGLEVQVSL